MKVEYHVCDKCGAKLDESERLKSKYCITKTDTDATSAGIFTIAKTEVVDLCDDCIELFEEWLENGTEGL